MELWNCIFFHTKFSPRLFHPLLAQRPNAGQGRLIFEASVTQTVELLWMSDRPFILNVDAEAWN
jgi:hypothetical protein